MNARLILTALRNLALGVGLVLCAIAGKAGGATIPTAADRPASEAFGAQQEETVWYEGKVSGVSFFGSGILIRGAGSDWVLTAAHNVKGTTATVSVSDMTVGNGTSYLNDPGQTSSVAEVIISPSYVPSNVGAGADFAFLRLTTRISSPSLYFRIGPTPGFNQPLLFAGFGRPSSMAEGTLPNTGNVMGFTALFSAAQPSGYNTTIYDSGQFFNSATGVGSGGDSGGSVKAWNGTTGRYEMVGLMVAAGSSATYYFNFNEAGFMNILTNTVQPVTAPVPLPALTCTIASGQVELAMANLVTNRTYRLMRSGTLAAGSWTQAHSFTATGPTANWSEPVAPEGRQFYRLEWTE